jgi:hypothetical protein
MKITIFLSGILSKKDKIVLSKLFISSLNLQKGQIKEGEDFILFCQQLGQTFSSIVSSLFSAFDGNSLKIISLNSAKNGKAMSSDQILIPEIFSLLKREILNSQYFSINKAIHLSSSLFKKTSFSHVKNIMFDFFIFYEFFKI